jgi:hypothetical protein
MSVKPAALIAAISRSLDTVTDAADAHVIQIQMFIVMKCLRHRAQYVLEGLSPLIRRHMM